MSPPVRVALNSPYDHVKVQVQGTSSNAMTDLQGVFEVTLVPARYLHDQRG